ncbi:lipid-binding SYLF domain-containing protein [Ruegeria lacuscaerulensis]|uniref:hypothetical protein n=1 Tax=Ruegeria lacuscaerulensis TaxID=55218 RepID=UPI00147D1BE1|nr:hypothetical protein [Ruegeria lacuscaerulensis]
MNKTVFCISITALLCGPAVADGLLDNIKKGAQKVGESVENTVNSTADLVKNEATPEETRAKLNVMADEVLTQLLAQNPEADALYQVSAGYAAFDSRKVTVFPVSAGYGRGVAVSRETDQHVYMNMGTGGVGAALGIGGFESKYVILFETQADLDKFITQGYEATAEAGTMQGDERTDEAIRFTDGRSFFMLDKKGWRVSAGATGTKYWKSPELN